MAGVLAGPCAKHAGNTNIGHYCYANLLNDSSVH